MPPTRPTPAVVTAALVLATALAGGVLPHLAPARAQRPVPTPGLPNAPGAFVGQPPLCDVRGRVDLDPADVAVGQTITTTVEIQMSCPHTYERAAVLLAFGGIDASARDSVAAAVQTLTDALLAEPDGALAVLPSGETASVAWATGDARRAVADAAAAVAARPMDDLVGWQGRMERAAAAFDRAPNGVKPILLVVQAADAGANTAGFRAAVDAAAIAVRDRVGSTIVLDASPTSWVLQRPTNLPDGVIGVVDPSPGARALQAGTSRLNALVNAPIEVWSVLLFAKGPLAFDVATSSPPADGGADDGSFLHWRRPVVSPYAARATARVAAHTMGAFPFAAVVAQLTAERAGTEAVPVQLVAETCLFPPEIGPSFCAPPTAPATPTPFPLTPPRQPTATLTTHPTYPPIFLPAASRGLALLSGLAARAP